MGDERGRRREWEGKGRKEGRPEGPLRVEKWGNGYNDGELLKIDK